MKKQLKESMESIKEFMRKNTLLIVSLKVLKLLIVFFLFSCGGKPESSKTPDTIRVDSINGNAPSDSVIYRNEEEEVEEGEEEDSGNSLVPQES